MTKWMALHDVDEFMAPNPSEFETIPEMMDDIGRRVDLEDINSVGFVQRLLLNCSNLKDGAHPEYEVNMKMESVWQQIK